MSNRNMKKIALYDKVLGLEHAKDIKYLIHRFTQNNIEIVVSDGFAERLKSIFGVNHTFRTFSTPEELAQLEVDVFLSIGGDGTFLDASRYVVENQVPIIGLNAGRLGFLSRISSENLNEAIDALIENNYTIEHRDLISVESEHGFFAPHTFALNELTVHKNDSSSMIIIHAYLNNEFLNSYWADGLIVSTPTGSTAYSLSCGGPIIAPESNCFVITPVAPHNLNVRPIVIPNNANITLKIEGRSDNFLLSLDSRTEIVSVSTELNLQSYSKKLKLIRLPNYSFLGTLRNKLNWGLDKRN